MPMSSVAVRSLTFALVGLGAASAFAQTANVTAFNPYNGVGLQGGQPPQVNQRAYPMAGPVVGFVGAPAGPVGGPAFNPWRPPSQAPARTGIYDPGSYLLAPPPGAIQSRLVAIPQRGDAPPAPRDVYYGAPRFSVPGAPPPAPAVVTTRTEPSPPAALTPPPAPEAVTTRSEPTPPAAPTPAPTVTPPPVPKPVATAAPTASPPQPAAAPPPTTIATTVFFGAQSTELNEDARAELNRVAKILNDNGAPAVDLRAHAGGGDPDSRKVSLARALVVRSYLIDRGLRSRIDVSAFAADGTGSASERVDVVAPAK